MMQNISILDCKISAVILVSEPTLPCGHLVYLIMISIETRVAFFLPLEPSLKTNLKGDGNHIHLNKKEILSIICFIKMFHIFLFLNFNLYNLNVWFFSYLFKAFSNSYFYSHSCFSSFLFPVIIYFNFLIFNC